MRKRYTLKVDKLLGRQPRKTQTPPVKPQPLQATDFETMYAQAKKHNASRNMQKYFSTNTSVNCNDSLKASRKTVNNTTQRVMQHMNRSLQLKKTSVQKEKRSQSNQRQHQQNKPEIHKQDESKKNQQKKSALSFQRQFNKVISGLDHKMHSHLRQTQCFLSIQEVFRVMKELHYLRKVEDERYLIKIWQELCGQIYGGIPCQNLYQLLCIINHQPSKQYYQKQQNPQSRIVINSQLKIVVRQQDKLQIYQDYLGLRVNRILYGQTTLQHKTSNIKIVDEEQSQPQKMPKKVVAISKKLAFAKKKGKQEPLNDIPLRKSIKVQGKVPSNDFISIVDDEKDQVQETNCYSQFSQSRQEAKQSQASRQSTQLEQVVIRKPILSVDVNLGNGITQKLMVFEGQSALQVSKRLVDKYHIEQGMRAKFESMLNSHIRNLLWRIEEVSQQMISDRSQ